MKGKLQIETVSSQVLKGNPLGDPHRREVPVYLPPSYGQKRGARYPVIYFLAGFTGGGRTAVNVRLWKENIAERLDRLIGEGKAREEVLVIPDCLTAYGGSQYLNSSATGRYEDHVVEELVPFFEDKLGLAPGPASRAVMGQSSGGYGAVMLGMKHPDVFAHVACHSGDMGFELCYAPDFPKFVSGLSAFGGSSARLARGFLASRRKDSFDHALVNVMGMASCYSPNPKTPAGFDLPFDERTAERVASVWARWLAHDPVVAAARHQAGLKRLKTFFLDAGRRDEFHLQLGARKLSDVLKGLKVGHTHEEHEFGHFDMAERYDRSLRLLAGRLSR